MKKRILSLLLCLAILLSLTACGGSGGDTTPPTTTVPPTTTEPAPDAAEIYHASADAVRAAESMVIDYTVETTMTVGTDTYLETETTSLSLSGIGTDDFTAAARIAYTWGEDYYADYSDVYIDGILYGIMDYTTYSAEMTGAEYRSRYLPGVLLTAELYESVEMTDENTVSFSGATALEPWLAQEDYCLVEASGTAYIDAGGELEDCTYHAVYSCGGVQFRLDVTSRATVGPITAVEAPADASAYAAVEYPDARLAYERAIGLAIQACDVTSTSAENIVIQAGAVAMSQQCTMNSFGTGSGLMAQFDSDITLLDLSTGITVDNYAQEELYRDGIYTIAENGSTPQANHDVTQAVVRNYCQAFVTDMFPYPEEIENLSLTDLGPALLLEYSFTEKAARAYTTMLCGAIYEDAELLDNLASDYRTDTACGYVGIDRITGLPLSLGIEYQGVHTIEGTECLLVYDHTQSVSVGTGESYKTITGEIPPAGEPETGATPLLYHVTGENGEEMWLFGTIHVGDARTAYLPQYLLDAFAASDALAVEFDSNAFEDQIENDETLLAQLQEYYFYTDGTVTADHIEDHELYDAAVQMLKAIGGYNANTDYLKPVIWGNTIENAYLDLGRVLSGVYGADNRLIAMAEQQGKEILSVESGAFQIGMLTGYSDALQEQLLLEAVSADPREYQESTMELYEMWCSGDEAALTEYLNEEADLSELTEEELALYEEYWNAMSTDRNAAMLEVAKEYLSGGRTVFYAVGLAHLLAEDGLVNTLRDAGFNVEPVSGK